MNFNNISVKSKHNYQYDRNFVKAHTDNDYIRPTGSVFPDDENTKSYHPYEKSNINPSEAENLYNKLLKSF